MALHHRQLIYLDYCATTPVDPRVIAVMQDCLATVFGNPSSQHVFGVVARECVEKSRAQVANLINANPAEIIFTSGATESINLALKGAAFFYQRQGRHIITLSTEHKAVLETCRYLSSQNFEITYLAPEKNGLLNIEKLRAAIRPDTILASMMHVNNETGVIQNIAAIGECLRERGVWFHVDAAQSVGKLPIDVKNLPVDLMSLASHKIYGPKGVGALFVRKHPRVQLISQLHGGDQENKIRSGTVATHQIVGMGEAYAIAQNNLLSESKHLQTLRDQLWKNLSTVSGVRCNGDFDHRVCNCLNVSIDDIQSKLFLDQLSDVAIATGSACNTVDPEPSHVLMAMGLSREQANCSVRLSVGRFTTDAEIHEASMRIIATIKKIRE